VPGYELLRTLGRGAMGVVYLGRSDATGELVAVKTVRPDEPDRGTYVRRLMREAHTLKTLVHPGIAGWIDLVDSPNGIYLVMQYVPGWYSLRDLLKRYNRIPPVIAARIVRQAVEALAYAESLHIIHRDIKPDNIMIAHSFEGPPPDLHTLFDHPQTRIMIIDFGLTKGLAGAPHLDAITTDGTAIGSPVYMAPEQALGRTVDFRTDMYALGTTFYQLLTGSTPFTAKTAIEALQKKVDLVDFPMPSQQGVLVPSAIEAVLKRMVAYKPADRYASYEVLMAVLDGILDGPTSTKPVGDKPGCLGLGLLFRRRRPS